MASPAARRRQRSTRLALAVVLLVAAAALVTWGVLDNIARLQSGSAILAVLLGAAATKITHSELRATRREAARDRAQQAREYRAITEARTAEGTAFAEQMGARVAEREETISSLETALSTAQRQVAETTVRADGAERDRVRLGGRLDDAEGRAAEAIVRVAELEAELDAARADLDALRTEADGWKVAARQASARRHA